MWFSLFCSLEPRAFIFIIKKTYFTFKFASNFDNTIFLFLQGKQFICIDADQTGTLIALGTKDGQYVTFFFICISNESDNFG